MARDLKKIIEKIGKSKHRIERRYTEFGVFILISAFFWLLNALSKDYTTTISLPVLYINLPEDKQLTNELPNAISLRAQGHGFDLLKQKFGIHIFPYKIDVGSLMVFRKKTPNQQRYTIFCKDLRSEIDATIDAQLLVKEILPDSIPLIFSPIELKKIAVKPKIKLEFAPQHQLHGKLKLTPDSIFVSGPQAVLDTLEAIYTEKLALKNINSSTQRNLKLVAPDKISLKKQRAVVGIQVDRFTEHSLNIPVVLKNKSHFKRVALLQKTVSVKFIVGLSDYNSIRPEDFYVSALLPAHDSIPEKLNVALETFPSSVSILSVSPKQVDYIIQKK